MAANKFVKCLAKCLGKSVTEIEKWYGECKKNIKCWAKKVGKAALKCGPKCLLPFSVDEPQLDESENNAVTAGRLNIKTTFSTIHKEILMNMSKSQKRL